MDIVQECPVARTAERLERCELGKGVVEDFPDAEVVIFGMEASERDVDDNMVKGGCEK